jgi:hypothetical protein
MSRLEAEKRSADIMSAPPDGADKMSGEALPPVSEALPAENPPNALMAANQALCYELMLQLGHDWMKFKHFRGLNLLPHVNQIEPKLLHYYLVYGSTEIRRNRVRAKAFEALLRLENLALLKRFIIEGKRRLQGWFSDDKVYLELLQQRFQGGAVPRPLLATFLPKIFNQQVDGIKTFSKFIEQEKNPYLFWLMLLLVFRQPERLPAPTPHWKQFPVIKELIAAIENRKPRRN